MGGGKVRSARAAPVSRASRLSRLLARLPSRPRASGGERDGDRDAERDAGQRARTTAQPADGRLPADHDARDASATARPSRSTSTRSCAPSSRCCVGPRPTSTRCASPRKTISGLYDGATTRELDQLSIQTAAALIVEEPQYARLAARLLADLHRQGGARTRRSTPSRSRSRPGTALGLVNERLADFVAEQRAQAQRRDRRRARPRVRVLRPAHRLRPLPAASTRRRAS